MTLPSSPGPAAAANSALACVNCAKSKARCDRKVPCTRCVRKKLTCQTRVSQRGARRLSFNINSNHHAGNNPETTTPQANSNGGGSGSRSGSGSGTGSGTQETCHGIWMDWSHRFDTIRRPKDLAEAAQKDELLAQFVAAAVWGGVDDSYPPPGTTRPDTTIITTMPPFPDPQNDLFDFTAPPSSSSSPTPQITLGPCEDTAFVMSPGALIGFSGNGDDDAMDGYVPTIPPLLRSVEPAFASSDPDQIEALEGWPLFRCNPVTPSSACHVTGPVHVKNLYTLLKEECTTTDKGRPPGSKAAVEPLLASTREKVTAVLQGLFYEAQQLYGLRNQDNNGLHNWVGASVLTLPPPSEMEFLLRAYADCCEPHYPVVPFASMKVNESIEGSHTILPSMALLLMMAIGAMTAGSGEPYPEIAYGLVDICRTSLRRLIEQNIKLASDPEVTQCALLLMIAMVWSGDKWQMDIAMYEKAMYLEMRLRAGPHDPREEQLARLDSSGDAARRWELWKCQERLNRVTCAWLVLDYEMCLFQDIPSTSFLSVVNLDMPIPSPDASLTAFSAKHWAQDASSTGRHTVSIPPSLKEWVACFTDTNDISTMTHVSPITLRILLCHLMDQVLQLRSRIEAMSTRSPDHKSSRHLSNVLLSVQVQEVQELLRKWFDLAHARCPGDTPANCANMVLYHLVVLNTMASVPEIERLARSGGGGSRGSSNNEPSTRTPPSRPSRSGRAYHLVPEDARDIYFHCGQVLRNLRLVPEAARPPWWAGAAYRAALIAWANSMETAGGGGAQSGGGGGGWDGMEAAAAAAAGAPADALLLDALPARDAALVAYLNHQGGGTPVFSDAAGATVSLADSVGILLHCARFLDSDIKTTFTRGIQQKLTAMARRWGGRVS